MVFAAALYPPPAKSIITTADFPSKEAQFNDLPTLADQVVVSTAVGEQISLLTHTPFTRNAQGRYA